MKKIRSNKYAIIILSAGASSRLGRPKQLVKYRDSNLLMHTINTVSTINNTDTYVVLGAYSNEILTQLDTSYPIYINPDWSQGMGNTISFGMKQIMNTKYDAIILTVCDQPYLKSNHFDLLINMYEHNLEKDIIISKYDKGNGPPSLFSSKYFNQLADLDGDLGAKRIVKNNLDYVGYIDFKQGSIDIDEEKDLSLF